eukprot:TRINITY_DN14268_c0_g1_i1.p1 TRINITY_DN14268_c0_g1~~TRINITY_DN14268_c0_g1_i1.p1  ORF type:complete len:177 (+),score=29.78 TRINITY_DN14268_c0_g1_i1:111-641(+)
MAHQLSRHGFCSPSVLRLVLVLVGGCLFGYLLGPPLYWYFTESLSGQSSSTCPPCVCDCSSESTLSMPLELVNSSFADCGGRDPDMNKEMEKDIVDLLAEEINLKTNVTKDNEEHTKASLLEARKTSSQYQKEAEKCNAGMETCEEARERAEADLRAELKLSALWEKRARARGWKD